MIDIATWFILESYDVEIHSGLSAAPQMTCLGTGKKNSRGVELHVELVLIFAPDDPLVLFLLERNALTIQRASYLNRTYLFENKINLAKPYGYCVGTNVPN